MLVECGFARAITADGVEFTFTPSFGRIAMLGDPQSIVALYAGLFGPRAEEDARYVLACLCDQDDPSSLIGWAEPAAADTGPMRVHWLEPKAAVGPALAWREGFMPAAEQVLLARHLMQHGIAGKATPGQGDGKFSDRFDAAEYISAARVHLGLSSADAEALSMTEFQAMFAMKFPDDKNRQRDVPDRAAYDAAMARLKEKARV
ncbi:DUF6246 family protein [soil metagenome]